MNDLQWRRNGHDHGAALAEAGGFTPLYLHYNSGRHVSTNGHDFAELLERPASGLARPGRGTGDHRTQHGRFAGAQRLSLRPKGGQAWPKQLRTAGVPRHPAHGAPLERGGNWIDVMLEISPYTAALARLAKIRSAGITDLRHGSILDQDWLHGDRFARSRKHRPATLARRRPLLCDRGRPQRRRPGSALLGDGLVPLAAHWAAMPMRPIASISPNQTAGSATA
jgi:hypothetical protein